MITDEVLLEQVKDKIIKYIKGNMDKARGLKLLKNEFKLRYDELSDLWLECKELNHNYGRSKTVTDLNRENRERKRESEELKRESEELKPTEKIDKSTKPKLEVIKVVTIIKGEYGTYEKTNGCVYVNNSMYNTKEDVRKCKETITSEYKAKLAKLDEIESVFDL